MSIYNKRPNSRVYRKIYEQHHGSIPKDSDGRSYDIHHIDGDFENNDPANLIALSIQDHYNIHYSQGDWGACFKIMDRMKKTHQEISKEISEISRRVQAERIKNNTHHFQKRQDGSSLTSDRTKNGLNPFSKRKDGTSVTSDQVAAGTHNFLNHDGKYRLDQTIYTFKNLETGEQVTMGRKEFVDTYNLHAHQGNLSSMINKKMRVGKKGPSPVTKHVKGWILQG